MMALKDSSCVSVMEHAQRIITAYVSFFATFRDGQSEHTFEDVPFDEHEGNCLAPLPWEIFEEGKILGIVELISLQNFHSVLWLVALNRTMKINCSYYVSKNLHFLINEIEICRKWA